MNFFSKIFGGKETTAKKSYSNTNWVNIIGGNDKESNIAYSWVYTGITTRAENLINANIYLYQKSKSGEIKELDNHPFLDMMNSFNLYGQTFEDIIYSISMNLDVYGNAFVHILKDKANRPAQFILLPTSKITQVFSENAVSGYEYRTTTKVLKYNVDEIIHFKLPSLDNQFYGTPTIQSCKFAIDIDCFQQTYQKAFYENNGAVGLALQTDHELSDEAFQRTLSMWNDKYSGASNANRVALLDNGLKIETFNNNPKEVDFKESRIELRDEILGKLRVPKNILGITQDVNRANADASIYTFTKFTIEPLSRFIVNGFNRFLKTQFDPSLYIKFEYEYDNTELYKMLLEHQVITIDEAREAFGFQTLKQV